MDYLHQFLFWVSDANINKILVTLISEYKVLTSVFLAPCFFWFLRKYTSFTPWTSDDKLADDLQRKFEGGSDDTAR